MKDSTNSCHIVTLIDVDETFERYVRVNNYWFCERKCLVAIDSRLTISVPWRLHDWHMAVADRHVVHNFAGEKRVRVIGAILH